MKLNKTYFKAEGWGDAAVYRVYTDDGKTEMSHASVTFVESNFNGNQVKAALLGGVGTLPEYRRSGCVRMQLDAIWKAAKEDGYSVCLLHPFSFNYYRKFGAERIYDTIQCDMPIYAISFVERYPDLVPFTKEHEAELLALFEKCNQNRNITVPRKDMARFTADNRRIYLSYNDAGEADGYIIIEPKNHYDGINRMISDNLIVWEMGYLNRDAIIKLLGFLRMFEGELETVHFHDIGPVPELDYVFKHYMHTRYDVHPDIAARILDTKAMLEANTYPTEAGFFTIRVEDVLDSVKGTYHVAYKDGKGEVTLLDDAAPADLTTGPQGLARLLYGVDMPNLELLSYWDGVTCHTDCKDLFRAFPKRINGLYEHF